MKISKVDLIGEENLTQNKMLDVNVSAEGGVGKLTYEFIAYLENGMSAASLIGSQKGSDNHLSLIPRASGNIRLHIIVTDESGQPQMSNKVIKVNKDEENTVVNKPENLRSSISIYKCLRVISWSQPTTTNGTIDGYYVFCNGKKIGQTSSNSFDTAVEKDDCTYTVIAYNDKGICSRESEGLKAKGEDYIGIKSIISDADNDTVKVGQSITFTTELLTNIPEIHYVYEIFDNDTAKMVGQEVTSTSNKYTWTPTKAGIYTIEVNIYGNSVERMDSIMVKVV